MKINHEKTYENCLIYNKAEIARQCDTTTTLVVAVIRGKYKRMSAPKPQRVIAKLRELGALVEIPDADDSRVAA